MRQTKHTPGPYECGSVKGGTYYIWKMNNHGTYRLHITFNNDGRLDNGDEVPDEELQATMNLMAAAPELLETLSDLIPYINECEQRKQIYRTQAQAIREVVSAAIAKVDTNNTQKGR